MLSTLTGDLTSEACGHGTHREVIHGDLTEDALVINDEQASVCSEPRVWCVGRDSKQDKKL